MTLPLTPARYGSGLMYAVFVPGVDEPHILCDDDDMDALYARAALEDGVLSFRGSRAPLTLADGTETDGLVGVGRLHAGPDSGVLVRYHDNFIGPAEEDGDDSGSSSPPDAPPAAPQRPSKPSGLPNISRLR